MLGYCWYDSFDDQVSKMKIYTQQETSALADILKHDGAISVPTDTVYGVCARMNSLAAQEHLRDVKNRPATKAFPIMCKDLEEIRSIAYTDARSEKLMRAFMPGPVTLILNKKENLPAYINGGMKTLAIRMAPSKVICDLIEKTGSPLFMTSANQSGKPVCKSLQEIAEQCPLLDAMMEGSVSFGEASTIVDCSNTELKILRKGPITEKDIQKVLL